MALNIQIVTVCTSAPPPHLFTDSATPPLHSALGNQDNYTHLYSPAHTCSSLAPPLFKPLLATHSLPDCSSLLACKTLQHTSCCLPVAGPACFGLSFVACSPVILTLSICCTWSLIPACTCNPVCGEYKEHFELFLRTVCCIWVHRRSVTA